VAAYKAAPHAVIIGQLPPHTGAFGGGLPVGSNKLTMLP
jgi:hypothetical protein